MNSNLGGRCPTARKGSVSARLCRCGSLNCPFMSDHSPVITNTATSHMTGVTKKVMFHNYRRLLHIFPEVHKDYLQAVLVSFNANFYHAFKYVLQGRHDGENERGQKKFLLNRMPLVNPSTSHLAAVSSTKSSCQSEPRLSMGTTHAEQSQTKTKPTANQRPRHKKRVKSVYKPKSHHTNRGQTLFPTTPTDQQRSAVRETPSNQIQSFIPATPTDQSTTANNIPCCNKATPTDQSQATDTTMKNCGTPAPLCTGQQVEGTTNEASVVMATLPHIPATNQLTTQQNSWSNQMWPFEIDAQTNQQLIEFQAWTNSIQPMSHLLSLMNQSEGEITTTVETSRQYNINTPSDQSPSQTLASGHGLQGSAQENEATKPQTMTQPCSPQSDESTLQTPDMLLMHYYNSLSLNVFQFNQYFADCAPPTPSTVRPSNAQDSNQDISLPLEGPLEIRPPQTRPLPGAPVEKHPPPFTNQPPSFSESTPPMMSSHANQMLPCADGTSSKTSSHANQMLPCADGTSSKTSSYANQPEYSEEGASTITLYYVNQPQSCADATPPMTSTHANWPPSCEEGISLMTSPYANWPQSCAEGTSSMTSTDANRPQSCEESTSSMTSPHANWMPANDETTPPTTSLYANEPPPLFPEEMLRMTSQYPGGPPSVEVDTPPMTSQFTAEDTLAMTSQSANQRRHAPNDVNVCGRRHAPDDAPSANRP